MTTSTPTAAAAEKALALVCEKHRIPGAVVGAMENGKLLFTTAYGVASLRSGLAVTPDTLFLAGSIGKSHTASLVLQLVDEGLVDLDTSVRQYVPDFSVADATATDSITVRQLLTHTSGIDGDKLDDYGRGEDCVARYVSELRDLPQIVEPGRIWSYSNAGYVVLGRLVEVLTGLSYSEALRQRLLAPLGLDTTVVQPEEAIAYHPAVGHLPGPDGAIAWSAQWALPRSLDPAGCAVITSVHDLLRYAQLHLDHGVASDGTRVLSAASVAEMQRPQVRCPDRDLLGDHWGLGWSVRTERGPVAVGHDGNSWGQSASLRLLPERNISYAFLCNLHGAGGVFAELCHELFDPWTGVETPGTAEPDLTRTVDGTRLVGEYAQHAMSAVVATTGGGLTVALVPSESSPYRGALDEGPRNLLPTQDEDTFLVDLSDVGAGRVGLFFVEPDCSGAPTYFSFAGRLYRRVLS